MMNNETTLSQINKQLAFKGLTFTWFRTNNMGIMILDLIKDFKQYFRK